MPGFGGEQFGTHPFGWDAALRRMLWDRLVWFAKENDENEFTRRWQFLCVRLLEWVDARSASMAENMLDPLLTRCAVEDAVSVVVLGAILRDGSTDLWDVSVEFPEDCDRSLIVPGSSLAWGDRRGAVEWREISPTPRVVTLRVRNSAAPSGTVKWLPPDVLSILAAGRGVGVDDFANDPAMARNAVFRDPQWVQIKGSSPAYGAVAGFFGFDSDALRVWSLYRAMSFEVAEVLDDGDGYLVKSRVYSRRSVAAVWNVLTAAMGATSTSTLRRGIAAQGSVLEQIGSDGIIRGWDCSRVTFERSGRGFRVVFAVAASVGGDVPRGGVRSRLNVASDWFYSLPLDGPVEIPSTSGRKYSFSPPAAIGSGLDVGGDGALKLQTSAVAISAVGAWPDVHGRSRKLLTVGSTVGASGVVHVSLPVANVKAGDSVTANLDASAFSAHRVRILPHTFRAWGPYTEKPRASPVAPPRVGDFDVYDNGSGGLVGADGIVDYEDFAVTFVPPDGVNGWIVCEFDIEVDGPSVGTVEQGGVKYPVTFEFERGGSRYLVVSTEGVDSTPVVGAASYTPSMRDAVSGFAPAAKLSVSVRQKEDGTPVDAASATEKIVRRLSNEVRPIHVHFITAAWVDELLASYDSGASVEVLTWLDALASFSYRIDLFPTDFAPSLDVMELGTLSVRGDLLTDGFNDALNASDGLDGGDLEGASDGMDAGPLLIATDGLDICSPRAASCGMDGSNMAWCSDGFD